MRERAGAKHVLTVRQALDLPAFADVRLSAGRGGLDNTIRWVHIVDLPEPSFEWARGGELLLTSGVSLARDLEAAPDLIHAISDRGLAGIVLSLGYSLQTTPQAVMEAADERGLPLLEAPPHVQFIDLTEAIFHQIVNRQQALQAQADEIHRSLMDLVLEGDSLQDVADALAGILGRSITVESDAFDVLADARAGPIDGARARSVAEGRTTPELAVRLLERGIYDRLLAERRPLRVPAMPDLDMTMERIVAPIIVSRQIIGYVWVIAGDRDLTDLDELAIERAATVAALLMLKDREVQDAELQLRGDLLDQLFSLSGPVQPALAERIHQLGFLSNRPYQVLIVEGQAPAGEGLLSLPRKIERWITQVDGPALVVPRERQVIVVLQSAHRDGGAPLARRLVEAMTHPAQPLRVGVGGSVDDLTRIKDSYAQAAEALEVFSRLGRTERVADFSDLGVLHWLYHLPDEVLEGNAYLDSIRALARHDREHSSELLTTLERYLEHGGRQSLAASDLNIHRNTLAYRLDQVEKILGLSTRDPEHLVQLRLAILAHRLLAGRRAQR